MRPVVVMCLGAVLIWQSGHGIDLLRRYPTTLTGGDTSSRARPWDFGEEDLFQISGFELRIGDLHLQAGPSDLGIGHSADGAVWALVLPREGGELSSSVVQNGESIANVWLRFHPKELGRLFPPETVTGSGDTNKLDQMRIVANAKFSASWQRGRNALIPEPKDLTLDVDTTAGRRRFFAANMTEGTAEYVSAFEARPVRLPPAFSVALAAQAFDQIWEAFDREYAMFVLRANVDWGKLREQYRPKALRAKSVYEFASVCADMLKPLRDLHIWLRVADADVLVFNRPRLANANPSASQVIFADLKEEADVQWATTTNKIGYLAIYNWSNPDVSAQCDIALEQLHDTRGLIVDVRLNGGGSEDLAQKVAGRFLSQDFVYAYSQFRNGTAHTNLTKKFERRVKPRGPWRYGRPVILLIGQKCMSSTESFVAMMSGDPELTTMGDHTCGSSGNPRMIRLPLDMSVSLPRWIDYLPDGTAIDEHGFQPQVRFDPQPGAFDGERDDLLTAALQRLNETAATSTSRTAIESVNEHRQ